MVTAPLHLPKPIVFAKEVQEIVATIIDSASSFVTTIENITGRVYRAAQKVFATLGFLGGVGAVFSAASFVSNVTKAIHASSAADRIKTVFRAIVDGSDAWGGVNGLLWAFEAVGVIAQSALTWTPIVNAIFFPAQIVSIGLDLHDHAETAEMRNELLPMLRAKDLTKACGYVAEHHYRIRKFCQLSKATELHQKAQTLFSRLTAGEEQARVDAAAFIQVLKTRVNTRYNLEVAALAAKVTTVASTAISLMMPLNAVSWCITAVSGIASTIIFGLQKLLLNKNPFAEPRDVWYERAAQAVRHQFNNLTNAIEPRFCRI